MRELAAVAGGKICQEDLGQAVPLTAGRTDRARPEIDALRLIPARMGASLSFCRLNLTAFLWRMAHGLIMKGRPPSYLFEGPKFHEFLPLFF